MTITSTPQEIRRALDDLVDPVSHACACLGAQGNDPLCPCGMASVIQWRGRWVQLSLIGKEAPSVGYLDDLMDTNNFSRNDQIEFEVALVSYPMHAKLLLVKAIRELTKLGLIEAKKLVERADIAPVPIFRERSRAEAHYLASKLEAAGATVDIR